MFTEKAKHLHLWQGYFTCANACLANLVISDQVLFSTISLETNHEPPQQTTLGKAK